MAEDISDLIECPNCSMFVVPDSARCKFCDALVFSVEQLTTNVRYVRALLEDRVAAIQLKGEPQQAEREVISLAEQAGQLFYQALAEVMLEPGWERRFKSRVARTIALLFDAFEGEADLQDDGPYRTASHLLESERARHLKQLSAALQQRLGVAGPGRAGSELQILTDLQRQDGLARGHRLALLDYTCYLCAFLDVDRAPYLEDLDRWVSGLTPSGLLELTRAAAYHRIAELEPTLRRLFHERDDAELMKAITRYMERVDAPHSALVEGVIRTIHQRLEQEEVPALMWHMHYLLTMADRSEAKPVLEEIKRRGSDEQIKWAQQQYRRALVQKIERLIT